MRTARNLVGMYGSSFNPLLAKSWRSTNPEKKPDRIVINGVNDLRFSVILGHFWPSRGGIGHIMLEVMLLNQAGLSILYTWSRPITSSCLFVK